MTLPNDSSTAAYLSDEIYTDLFNGQDLDGTGRFIVRESTLPITPSGYYGAVIEDTSTGEVYVVSRGTEFPTPADLGADYDIFKGDIPEQAAWQEVIAFPTPTHYKMAA